MSLKQSELKQKVEEKRVVKLSDLRDNHNPLFKKTDADKSKLITAKKAHNKKWLSIFGTKRPSAGVVKNYFLSQ